VGGGSYSSDFPTAPDALEPPVWRVEIQFKMTMDGWLPSILIG
jgi:hypothetical protein